MPRVLIVGGGVAGAATAWSLAQRGERDVVLLEREPLLGTHSSGLNAAILRTLSADAVTSAFSRRGAQFLNNPPKGFSAVPLADACGLVLTADESGAPELLDWFERAGPESGGSRLSPEGFRELLPRVGSRPALALFFPREGRIDIAALMAGYESGARRAGVAIETGDSVEALRCEGGRVRGVRLSSGKALEADWTVLAAGAWAGRLGRQAGSQVELTPRRRHLLVTAPDARLDPSGPVFWHHGRQPFYARPESGGMLVCGCDETVVDPDTCTTAPSERENALLLLGAHMPSLADAGAHSFWAGMRTFASDGDFAIGPDPDLAGLFWVAGLGGHGMVCSSAVGELAADRLLGLGSTAGAYQEAAQTYDPARLVASGQMPTAQAE